MTTMHNGHVDGTKAPPRARQRPKRVVRDRAAAVGDADLAILQRAIDDPTRAQPAAILAMQPVLGNRTVSHLVQAKRPAPSSVARPRSRPRPSQPQDLVQRVLDETQLAALGITEAQYRRLKLGDRRFIEALFRQGNVEAAASMAQASIGMLPPGRAVGRGSKTAPSAQPQPPQPQAPGEQKASTAARAQDAGINWSAATKVRPSEGGAMGGIMLVTAGGQVHVLKAISSGAGTIFGEKMLAQIGGAITTESHLIPNNNQGEGAAIMGMLERFKGLEQDDKVKARWERNLPFFKKAPYIALQKNMVAIGGVEMEEIVHSGDPERIKQVLDPTLLYNLGRALAADTLIGNADRFEGMNTGNAFIVAKRQIGAIDTTTLLQNYDAYMTQGPGSVLGRADRPAEKWVEFILKEGTELGAMAPSANVERILSQFDNWYTKAFQAPLREKLTGKFVMSSTPLADEEKPVWNGVKERIQQGLEDGLKEVDKVLKGERYKQLKAEFKAQEAAYGPDVNFDWRAFKARRAYIVTLREGKSADEATQNAVAVAAYMYEWKPQVRSLAQFDPALNQVPDRPPALTKKQKARRFFSRHSEAEKEAKRLKKQARAGQIDPELYAKVQQSAAGDRRRTKALFETKFALFTASMRDRTAALRDLAQEDKELRVQAVGQGPTAELAQKKLAFIRKFAFSPELDTLLGKYGQAKDAWLTKLDPKKDASYVQSLTQGVAQLNGALSG